MLVLVFEVGIRRSQFAIPRNANFRATRPALFSFPGIKVRISLEVYGELF